MLSRSEPRLKQVKGNTFNERAWILPLRFSKLAGVQVIHVMVLRRPCAAALGLACLSVGVSSSADCPPDATANERAALCLSPYRLLGEDVQCAGVVVLWSQGATTDRQESLAGELVQRRESPAVRSVAL